MMVPLMQYRNHQTFLKLLTSFSLKAKFGSVSESEHLTKKVHEIYYLMMMMMMMAVIVGTHDRILCALTRKNKNFFENYIWKYRYE